MSEVVLSIKNLTKHYGRVRAVEDLSLDVHRGQVYGILGPNGSGKTTTLGMILDVINPKHGSYLWFGNPSSSESRKKIGAILEQPLFYPYLSAHKNLEIIADIKGIPYDNINNVLASVGLQARKMSKFKTFSYGMRQRMAIAAALLSNPEVLILDEPTNGLDPQGIAEIRSLIRNIAAEGTTIILASHLLDEVQKTCTHVAVLEKGRKLFSGSVAEVLNDTVQVELAADNMDNLRTALEKHEMILGIQKENAIFLVKLAEGYTAGQLNKYLFDGGIVLSHLNQRKKTLEKYFLELLEESNDQTD